MLTILYGPILHLMNVTDFAPLAGYLGAATSVILSNVGAAVGTYKSAIGIAHLGIVHPSGVVKNLLSVIMSGVVGLFGLILAIVIASNVTPPTEDGYRTYSEFNAWRDLSAGIICGVTCLAAGWSTGVAAEAGITATGMRAAFNIGKANRVFGGGLDGDEGDAAKIYVSNVTILSFASAIALYAFIAALITAAHPGYYCGQSE